jgi:hypothetical protein
MNKVFNLRVLLKAWNRIISETTISFSVYNLHRGVGSATHRTKILIMTGIWDKLYGSHSDDYKNFWEAHKRFGGTSHFRFHSSLPENGNGFLPNGAIIPN